MAIEDPRSAIRGTYLTMPDGADMDWNHLRIFLAVMRASSLREAADRLGISHPTIRRHLNALEGDLGLRLFDRRADGMHAMPEASELMAVAEQMESLAHTFARRASDADPKMTGSIRLTAPAEIVSELLIPELAAFSARWPDIDLHVEPSEAIKDLGRREADVAIRTVPYGSSPGGDVTGRKAATINTAVYGTGETWLGWYGDQRDRSAQAASFAGASIGPLPVRNSMKNTYLLRAACVEGMGVATLPCFMAPRTLERRTKPKPFWDIWVLVHPDLRRKPRLRIFRDEIVAALKRLRPLLAGKPAAGR